jgi:DNA-binding CsgD family transcriptional regulator
LAGTTREKSGDIVGRQAELRALDAFLSRDVAPRALILTGGPGIGKSTLWEAGVDLARQRGFRVLSARGSDAETRLSSAALVDLLDGVGREEFAGLPPPQLHALEVALFRAEPADTAPEAQAIAVGLSNALRSLAARESLLVAVDDVQWLDETSGDAIAFAARRLDAEPLAYLLARRPGTVSALERALEGRLERVEVGHLSLGATRRVLSDRLGLSLPRNVLRRIFETTLGNPLFTLELGRTLASRGPPDLGEDVPLPDTIEELLGTRVASLPRPVRRLVLAVALSGDLRASQAAELSEPTALDEAIDLGVLTVDGDRLRPGHPLFATAARSRADVGEQRELHGVLARLAADDESRAVHLALATEQPDEDLAAAVGSAAAGAAARGARRDAVVLAEHALRLTPPARPERSGRLLALGRYLAMAGEPFRLTDLLSAELDSLPAGEARVRALLLLTSSVVQSNDEIRRYLADALTESGENAVLRASVLVEIAENDAVIRVERIRAAETLAQEALETAGAAGSDLERRALYVLAWPRALRGRPLDDLRERFRAVPDGAWTLAESPERVAGQQLMWRGETEQARVLLTELLTLADERGEAYSYILHRLHMCQLELRIGAWESAERLLGEWAESSERVMWPMYERCRALLAAGRGLPEQAERWAALTLERAEATGTGWDRLEALRARGSATLLAGEPERAAESLGAVWEQMQREGVDEPGVFPVAPELVEALVELGELEEAIAVSGRLHALSEEQRHPWGLATVKRCDGLVRLAAGSYDEEAVAALAQAATDYGALGLRFDRARALLALGRVERRLKKWRAARDSLQQAAAAFAELGSTGWAERARAELSRVGGRRSRSTGDELTPTERRVAELAADGLANKEIAHNLSMSVRTVEVHLKHAYTKLGIHSRAQLARSLSERP